MKTLPLAQSTKNPPSWHLQSLGNNGLVEKVDPFTVETLGKLNAGTRLVTPTGIKLTRKAFLIIYKDGSR
jgi:hypothetical protein